MQYQNQKIGNLNLGFQVRNFYSILGLYIFSLGSLIGGFSFYLLLESTGLVELKIISWNGQGMFWFLILFFFISIFTFYTSRVLKCIQALQLTV